MKRVLWMVLTLTFAAGVGQASNPPTPASVSGAATFAQPMDAAGDVLYDQTDHDEGSSISSQDFESSMDAYDSQAADDFVIPAGQTWTITGVDARGTYYNGTGPADSFNVFFYADEGGLPGTAAHSAMGVAYVDVGNGSPVMQLGSPVVLSAGTWWVSIQARMDLASGGQWAWADRAARSGAAAVWRNPGGGFATSCTYWTLKPTCVPAAVGPDMLFRLRGTKVGGRNGARWDFDDALPPALAQGWTTSAEGAGEAWVTQSAMSDSPPNAAHAPDLPASGEASLYSPALRIGVDALLEFTQRLNTENGWDGGVLEISIDGAAFQDIVDAGGRFVAGGYNGTLGDYAGCAASPNPIANRSAWTGPRPSALTTTVAMPASAAGHTAQFRWRLGSDCSYGEMGGWWIDTVTLSDGVFCGGFERGGGGGTCAGHAARVFETRAAFLAQLASGYYEETFDGVPVNAELMAPLDFSNGPYSFSVFTQQGASGGLYNHPGLVTTNQAVDRVRVTFTPPVRAIGGHFWAINLGWVPTATPVVLTLSDGTVETVPVTTTTTFRGIIASSPIAELTIDAPEGAPGPGLYYWSVLDDLIAGTPN